MHDVIRGETGILKVTLKPIDVRKLLEELLKKPGRCAAKQCFD
jgi:hypothetical protein